MIHVAVIPDGNRRWAELKGLNAFKGHEAGVLALESIVRVILPKKEISWFTFWGASVGNLLKRSPEEVGLLNNLFAFHLRKLAKDLDVHENRVRVLVLGEWDNYLSIEAQEAVRAVMKETETYGPRTFTILLAYDGQREMVAAIRKIAEIARQDAQFEISPELVRENLITKELPPVDLLIRTGSEPHFSAGFLMWQTVNAQLLFSDRLWPDFTPEDFEKSIADYQSRERRFGV